MDDPALTHYVVSQLGKHVTRDNLIFDLCNRAKIAWRQSLLLFLVALGILVGGLWAAGGAITYFFGLWRQGAFSLDPFALRRDYVMVIRFGSGLAAVIGSVVGILKIFWDLLSKT